MLNGWLATVDTVRHRQLYNVQNGRRWGLGDVVVGGDGRKRKEQNRTLNRRPQTHLHPAQRAVSSTLNIVRVSVCFCTLFFCVLLCPFWWWWLWWGRWSGGVNVSPHTLSFVVRSERPVRRRFDVSVSVCAQFLCGWLVPTQTTGFFLYILKTVWTKWNAFTTTSVHALRNVVE